MMVKVFQTNAHGKIEFSRNELENLLNEIYNDGYAAGEKHMRETYWTWSPTLTGGTITTSKTLPITYSNKVDSLNNLEAHLTPTDTAAKAIEIVKESYTTPCADKVNTHADANCAISGNPNCTTTITANAGDTSAKSYLITPTGVLDIKGSSLGNELESIINHIFGEKKETSTHRNDAYGDLAKELSSL